MPGDPQQNAETRQSVAQLYARAWTTYSESTYDHSISLMEARLRSNGLDEAFFRNKVCFDGGCGTGRFAIAMAKAGARRVVAMDACEALLEYLRRTMERYRLQRPYHHQGRGNNEHRCVPRLAQPAPGRRPSECHTDLGRGNPGVSAARVAPRPQGFRSTSEYPSRRGTSHRVRRRKIK